MNVAELLPKQPFKGKTVFVTGGGSGINLGIGKTFAALGANIAICGRTRERLDIAAAELRAIGAGVVAEVADVRQYDALQAALPKCRDQLGPVDVLVARATATRECIDPRLCDRLDR